MGEQGLTRKPRMTMNMILLPQPPEASLVCATKSMLTEVPVLPGPTAVKYQRNTQMSILILNWLVY